MPILFHATAPDGTKEYLCPRGYVLTREEALAQKPQWADATTADDELQRRLKLWSIRGDVHPRESGLEHV